MREAPVDRGAPTFASVVCKSIDERACGCEDESEATTTPEEQAEPDASRGMREPKHVRSREGTAVKELASAGAGLACAAKPGGVGAGRARANRLRGELDKKGSRSSNGGGQGATLG